MDHQDGLIRSRTVLRRHSFPRIHLYPATMVRGDMQMCTPYVNSLKTQGAVPVPNGESLEGYSSFSLPSSGTERCLVPSVSPDLSIQNEESGDHSASYTTRRLVNLNRLEGFLFPRSCAEVIAYAFGSKLAKNICSLPASTFWLTSSLQVFSKVLRALVALSRTKGYTCTTT